MDFYRRDKQWASEKLEDALRMIRDYSCRAGMALMQDRDLRYKRLMNCSYLLQMALVRKERGW